MNESQREYEYLKDTEICIKKSIVYLTYSKINIDSELQYCLKIVRDRIKELEGDEE
jgi:hypothetical protein